MGNKFLSSNFFNFLVDMVFCVLGSLLSILLIRLIITVIPNYTWNVLTWTLASILASGAALYFSKEYLVVFYLAVFKSIWFITKCALIKTAFLCILFVFNPLADFPGKIALVAIDFTFTVVILIFEKSTNIRFVKELNKEIEEEESRAVSCLNVLVYGTSPKSTSTATRYTQSKNYNILGFLTRDKNLDRKIIMELPVHYLPLRIDEKIFKNVEVVLFTREEDWTTENDSLVKYCFNNGICVLTIPSVEQTNYSGFQVKEIKHMLEGKFIPDRMSQPERTFKRFTDLVVAIAAIIIFSPLMAVIAIVLRINEGKPVIYRQERIGQFGRPFNILKFRTMRLDAEKDGPTLYSGKDDPRLTKTGKFLRDHHLDELPQLFNILRGEMSLVGYRPERRHYINQIIEQDPRYSFLFQIKPGVTSYATLRNGYTDTMEKMLKRLSLDLYYMNHRNLFMEMKILWDTFFSITAGKKF